MFSQTIDRSEKPDRGSPGETLPRLPQRVSDRQRRGVKAGALAVLAIAAATAAAPLAEAARPSTNASADLTVDVVSLEGQRWEIVPADGPVLDTGLISTLYGCVTVSQWCLYCSCSSGQMEVADCEITTCRVPSWEPGQFWEETVEYSAGCAYCTMEGGPDSCPIEDCLPDLGGFLDREPLIYDYNGDSGFNEDGDGVNVWFMQTLELEDELQSYGAIGSARFDCDINNGLIFTRPDTVSPDEPTTLELNFAQLSMLLETGSGEETIGFDDSAWLVTSPQFGVLFECSVHQPKWGMAQVIGHVPPEAFELSPGRAELTGYQHPPIVIQVPPGMMEVVVEFQYISVGAADFDRNGNGNPDQFDIDEGFSADENNNLIPDEVEPFGLLHTALRQAVLSAGQSGELVVGNIGPTGQDGVRADLGQAASYRGELAPLPPVESLPVGAEFSSTASGLYDGQPGTQLGQIRSAKVEAGEWVALFADFSSIDVEIVDIIMIDGEETEIYGDEEYELDPEIPFGLASRMPTAVSWLNGSDDDPVVSDELVVILDYEGPGEYVLGGELHEIDNAILVVEIDNSIFMPKPDYLSGVRHRAAEIQTFALVSETAEPAEPDCPGDFDGDGQVGLEDLAQLLAHYGTSEGATYEDGDLDGDEDVDLADLGALLAVYGTTCE
jgi:hypothetical protein